ncbi:hypothetical protein H8B09_20840 [Paenibacillus sp. PR3]|uniref:Uncharacterized protein n=1 Tax=Paenibacillus terricola TaxID=2763503 RepID=A0ABR8MZ63_9BACL|nr:hypothetical protein [Paenibacillus terricola]MBD3921227.1 hypothetical protein [Paenibacillus terricola]
MSITLGCIIAVLIVVASSERAESIAELNEDDPVDARQRDDKRHADK